MGFIFRWNIDENQSQFLFVMFKLWTNKNHSYKHNEQINNQNIDNSECFVVKFVKIYPKMTSQFFWERYGFGWLYRDLFLHVAILLARYCIAEYSHDFSLFSRSTGYM